MLFRIPDMRAGYVHVLKQIMEHGEVSAPRGAKTREILGATIILENPYDALPFGTERGVNARLAATEATQIIGGFSNARDLLKNFPTMHAFADGGEFHGAYGPRLRYQLPFVVQRLSNDPETRRAVCTIWDPQRDLHIEDSRNYPCTTELQFFVRYDQEQVPRLILHTTMRANDAWHGMAYDVFTFAQLQVTVANALGIMPGHYYHHATSLHLYEEHWDSVSTLNANGPPPKFYPAGYGIPAYTYQGKVAADGHERVLTNMVRARKVSIGETPPNATPTEQWYLEKYARA